MAILRLPGRLPATQNRPGRRSCLQAGKLQEPHGLRKQYKNCPDKGLQGERNEPTAPRAAQEDRRGDRRSRHGGVRVVGRLHCGRRGRFAPRDFDQHQHDFQPYGIGADQCSGINRLCLHVEAASQSRLPPPSQVEAGRRKGSGKRNLAAPGRALLTGAGFFRMIGALTKSAGTGRVHALAVLHIDSDRHPGDR
jgi:hypothetical protein